MVRSRRGGLRGMGRAGNWWLDIRHARLHTVCHLLNNRRPSGGGLAGKARAGGGRAAGHAVNIGQRGGAGWRLAGDYARLHAYTNARRPATKPLLHLRCRTSLPRAPAPAARAPHLPTHATLNAPVGKHAPRALPLVLADARRAAPRHGTVLRGRRLTTAVCSLPYQRASPLPLPPSSAGLQHARATGVARWEGGTAWPGTAHLPHFLLSLLLGERGAAAAGRHAFSATPACLPLLPSHLRLTLPYDSAPI